MICPKCNGQMEPVAMENVTVERCAGCQGIWVDAGEVAALREIRGSEAIDTGDARSGKKMNAINNINCPRCQKPMKQMVDVDQHHIQFEACTECKGIYLDAGEFKDLKSFTIADYLRGLFTHRKKTPK